MQILKKLITALLLCKESDGFPLPLRGEGRRERSERGVRGWTRRFETTRPPLTPNPSPRRERGEQRQHKTQQLDTDLPCRPMRSLCKDLLDVCENEVRLRANVALVFPLRSFAAAVKQKHPLPYLRWGIHFVRLQKISAQANVNLASSGVKSAAEKCRPRFGRL